jgi:hypothetical protein
MLANHNFAVLEFQRVGRARVGDAMHLGPLGEILKDRMQVG